MLYLRLNMTFDPTNPDFAIFQKEFGILIEERVEHLFLLKFLVLTKKKDPVLKKPVSPPHTWIISDLETNIFAQERSCVFVI